MQIDKSKMVSFLIFFLLSLPPIIFAVLFYRPVMSVFPNSPELEVHFYLIALSVVFAILFSFYILSFQQGFIKKILNWKGVIKLKSILYFLIILLLGYLGYFIKEIYPFLSQSTTDFRDIGINVEGDLNIELLIVIAIIIFGIFLFITKLQYQKKYLIFYLVSIITIVWLSFNIKTLNDYDFSYFAGPINDVLHGKHLLDNSPSQYGFLSIIFLSLIFKFIPLGLMNLTIVNAISVSFGFILIFVLLQFLYKNKLLSLFTTIFIIFTNYTIQIVPEITFLQTNFLRFGMWVILALCLTAKLFYEGRKNEKIVKLLPLLALTIAFFWNLDSGLYALAAYFTYIAFNNLQPTLMKTIKSCLPNYLTVFMALLIGMLVIDISYKLSLGIYPNWRIYLVDPLYYLGGFSMFPWGSSVWPWFIVLGYLLFLSYLFVKKMYRKGVLDRKDQLASFVLFYGIFQFIYFVGESHLNNLHHIIIPFLIISFYILDIFLEKIDSFKSIKLELLTVSLITLVLLLPAYFIFIQGSKNIQKYNLTTSVKVIEHKDKIELEYLDRLLGIDTIRMIQDKYGNYINKYGITLISATDTWILIGLGTSNNIEGNFHYYTDHSLSAKVAMDILKKGDKYLFIDTKMKTPRTDSIVNIYNKISDRYKIIDTLGTLYVAERE